MIMLNEKTFMSCGAFAVASVLVAIFIGISLPCSVMAQEAQNNEVAYRHSLSVFVEPSAIRFPLSQMEMSGTGATLMDAKVNDLILFFGLDYNYRLSSRWSLHSRLTAAEIGGIAFGFQYENGHIYTTSTGTFVDSRFDSYGTAMQGYAVLFDVGSSFSIVESNFMSIKLGASLGAMINDINRSDEMIRRYIMPDGSLGEIYYGQYDIRQANYLSPYGLLELTGQLKLTDQFFIHGGLVYRVALSRLADDAHVELVDGIGQVSNFRFSAGFAQIGIRVGAGYRF